MWKRRSATKLNSQGLALEGEGRIAEAEAAYRQAAEADPSWGTPWFNLGLIAKRRRQWRVALRCNQEAAARKAGEGEAAWWNLGIAASALGDWSEARRAWRGFGIEIPDGDGPPELDLGLTPIRINPESDGEVVWCHRHDPARASIRNIPFPESGHAFGDLLLHDGAPHGERLLNGEPVAVFDEIVILEPSEASTFELSCLLADGDQAQTLKALGEEQGIAVEDWSHNVRFLCQACSEGLPHDHHDQDVAPTVGNRIGIAARSETEVRDLLDRWLAECGSVQNIELRLALDAVGRASSVRV